MMDPRDALGPGDPWADGERTCPNPVAPPPQDDGKPGPGDPITLVPRRPNGPNAIDMLLMPAGGERREEGAVVEGTWDPTQGLTSAGEANADPSGAAGMDPASEVAAKEGANHGAREPYGNG